MIFTFGQNTFAQTQDFLNLPEDAKLRLGKGTIRDITYSPDGQLLAVASSIGIWLYDTVTYQEVNLLTGQDMTWAYGSVAFSPDGKTLASVIADSADSPGRYNTVRLYDVATGAEKGSFLFSDVSSIAFSPDGRTLAIGIARSGELTVRLVDIATATEKSAFSTGNAASGVYSMVFSPDGRTLATGMETTPSVCWLSILR